MFDPRKLLMNELAKGAANWSGTSASANECVPPLPGAHSAYIPNPVLLTHLEQKVRFYDDLIRPRIVLINCISIRDGAGCSAVETLAKVQPLIGEDLGRRVFFYSLTTDPLNDTPSALRAFAAKHQAGNGWLFLTGEAADQRLIRERLFTHGGGQDCSGHIVRYGNEEVGLWGGVAATATAESIAQRISWITPGERPVGPPKRGGPWPLDSQG